MLLIAKNLLPYSYPEDGGSTFLSNVTLVSFQKMSQTARLKMLAVRSSETLLCKARGATSKEIVLLYPEDGSNKFHRNIGNGTPVYAASHLRTHLNSTLKKETMCSSKMMLTARLHGVTSQTTEVL
jgi:hypothetical protein